VVVVVVGAGVVGGCVVGATVAGATVVVSVIGAVFVVSTCPAQKANVRLAIKTPTAFGMLRILNSLLLDRRIKRTPYNGCRALTQCYHFVTEFSYISPQLV
jgi:mannose/fructose/N-acetylgalactosamine-specific phosphotransferase system component IIC